MIGVDVDWFTVDVEVKVLTRPYYGEGFTLSLAVALLGGGQRATGVRNDTPGPLYLCNACQHICGPFRVTWALVRRRWVMPRGLGP